MKFWKLKNNAYSLILSEDGRYITNSEVDVDNINLADIEDTSSWLEIDIEQVLKENEIVEEYETGKKWYAVQETREDAWDNGSYNLDEAIQIAREEGKTIIAVIENDVCVEEIEIEKM